MRKLLFVLAAAIFAVCLLAAGFFYWRIAPPFGSFPWSAGGARRQPEILYKKTEDVPGVYLAIYGTEMMHSVYPTASAGEAAALVRRNREYVQKRYETELNRLRETNKALYEELPDELEKDYRQTPGAVYLAPEDSPENDYLVYVQNGRALVDWANGSWFCSINSGADYNPSAYDANDSAKEAFAAARSFSYGPKNAPPYDPKYERATSLYEIVMFSIPARIKFWLPVLFPLGIGFVALIVMMLTRRRKVARI